MTYKKHDVISHAGCFKNLLLELILPKLILYSCIIKKIFLAASLHFEVRLFPERSKIQMQNGGSTHQPGFEEGHRRGTGRISQRAYANYTHTHTYFGKSGGTQVREDKRARRRGVTRRGASPLLQRNCRKSVGRRRRTSRTRRDAPFRGPAIKYRPLVISCASPLVPPFLELERWRNSINFKSRRREKSNEII